MTKNKQIRQTILQTRKRRKDQVCKVFELKFDRSYLSREKLNHLRMFFVEAKWLYNYQLSLDDPFKLSWKEKQVEVLNKNRQKEKRKLDHLSSQMRQALVGRTIQNILNLSKSKKSGNKVGRLGFKSRVNSIPLVQFGVTYKIEESKNYVKIQGFSKEKLKVIGLDQIPEDAEIANANLIQRNKDYYLQITTFVSKENKIKTGKSIGLDFGIKNSVVDSNGSKYDFRFPEPKQLKKAQKKLARKKKGSSNRYKQKLILARQYEKLTNKKKDVRNKFVSKLCKENDIIVIQDESVAAWRSARMKGWGRKTQYSIIGGIISSLKNKPETLVIDKYFPSTQLCSMCVSLNKIGLERRIYSCSCGHSEDRDIHAARNILNEGLRKLGREPIKAKPVERQTFGSFRPKSYLVETGSLSALAIGSSLCFNPEIHPEIRSLESNSD